MFQEGSVGQFVKKAGIIGLTSTMVSCTPIQEWHDPSVPSNASKIAREWFPYKEGRQVGKYDNQADFGDGIMNGTFSPFTWVASNILQQDIGVYRQENNGFGYNLGFYGLVSFYALGVLGMFLPKR